MFTIVCRLKGDINPPRVTDYLYESVEQFLETVHRKADEYDVLCLGLEYNLESRMQKKIVCFSATWCGPCKAIKPILNEISAEKNINLEVIDVDQNQDMAREFGIRGVPTTILMVDDKVEHTIIGMKSKNDIIKDFAL